jgi:hypothetical protein
MKREFSEVRKYLPKMNETKPEKLRIMRSEELFEINILNIPTIQDESLEVLGRM